MKKLLSLKTLLICISFTVFLLLVKDNMNVVWSAIGWITGIITPFAIGFLFQKTPCAYYNLCNCRSNFCRYNLNCSSADCSQPVQSY